MSTFFFTSERYYFFFSPASHLHFSIKHPHTLSWEYYTMFQCKAHLVMRLIENRISMEFMLQVSANTKNLTTLKGLESSETSEPIPSGTAPPARPHLLVLKQPPAVDQVFGCLRLMEDISFHLLPVSHSLVALSSCKIPPVQLQKSVKVKTLFLHPKGLLRLKEILFITL